MLKTRAPFGREKNHLTILINYKKKYENEFKLLNSSYQTDNFHYTMNTFHVIYVELNIIRHDLFGRFESSHFHFSELPKVDLLICFVWIKLVSVLLKVQILIQCKYISVAKVKSKYVVTN